MENEINALAEFLGVSPDEISNEYGHVYYTDEGEYWVGDYDEARADAIESSKNLLDDLGLDSFSEWAQNEVIENFAKSDWFQDAMEESNRFYAEDIASEDDWEFGNRLVQECYEEGLITDEDFGVGEDGEPDHTNCLVDKEDLIERRADAMNEDDPIEWYRMNFGDNEFNEVVKKNGLIDWDAAAEWSVDQDGPANNLASYDGKENTQEYDGETYFIYRVN